jgi:hypothetical protein
MSFPRYLGSGSILVRKKPTLAAKQKCLDLWYHHGMSPYQTDARIDEYIQTLAFLTAGDVPPSTRSRTRR